MSTSFSIDVEVEVEAYCAKCGATLDCDGLEVGRYNRSTPSIDVEPCETCRDEAVDAAVEEEKRKREED